MSTLLYPGRRVMWLPLELGAGAAVPGSRCCPAMDAAIDFTCAQHADPFDCPDALIVYHDVFGEYGLAIRDGGPSYVLIEHCPWCGTSLGKSQRDRWFEELEAIGIIEPDASNVPPQFLTSAWRQTPAKET